MWTKENLGPVLKKLLADGPLVVEVVDLSEELKDWLKGAKDLHGVPVSKLKVWIRILRKEISWINLGEAAGSWSRCRTPTQWPIKLIKAETVKEIIAGAV